MKFLSQFSPTLQRNTYECWRCSLLYSCVSESIEVAVAGFRHKVGSCKNKTLRTELSELNFHTGQIFTLTNLFSYLHVFCNFLSTASHFRTGSVEVEYSLKIRTVNMLVAVYLKIVFYTACGDVKGSSSNQHPGESRKIIHEHRNKDIAVQKMERDDRTKSVLTWRLLYLACGFKQSFRWCQQVLPKHL